MPVFADGICFGIDCLHGKPIVHIPEPPLFVWQQPMDDAQDHQLVAFAQLLHSIDGLLDQLWVRGGAIEKLLRGNAEVIAYGEEFL